MIGIRVVLAIALLGGTAYASPIQEIPGQGGIRVDFNLEVSIADGAFFEPTSMSPDFYYGFSKAIVVGLTHSAASQGVVGVGKAIQLNGGDDAYNGVNLELFIPLLNAAVVTVAPNVAFSIDQMDPLDYSIKAGALLSVSASSISLVGMPHMLFPVNHRSPARDNILRVPIWFYYHWKTFFSLYLLSGLNDGSLQLAMGAVVSATESIRLGAQFGWPRFAGDNNSLDTTALTLFGQFVF